MAMNGLGGFIPERRVPLSLSKEKKRVMDDKETLVHNTKAPSSMVV